MKIRGAGASSGAHNLRSMSSGGDRTILITFDTDWAPDWIIDDVADMLIESKVRATWFVTNDGAATRALRKEPLFEVGLHPNFLSGSTHGITPESVMTHLKAIVPEAVSVRSHSLCQAEPWLRLMAERFGIANDCSIHLPLQAGVAPHVIRLGEAVPPLLRLPHVFQDNMYMFIARPWSLEQLWFTSSGLKVFCFHPIHVVMNACTMAEYERVKARGPIARLRPNDVPRRALGEGGCRDLLRQLLAIVRTESTHTVKSYASWWLEGQGLEAVEDDGK